MSSKLIFHTIAACLVAMLGVHCSDASTTGGGSASTGGMGGSNDSECVEGDTRTCLGPGACVGAQECNPEGTGWKTCDCGSGTGGESSGTGGEDSGTGGDGTGGTILGGSGGDQNGSGGGSATGGVNGSGGSATGGANGTGGGASTGGSNGTGGNVSTGGGTSTGGSVSTGGSNGTGGSVSTGGAGTGGSATGGASTGGAGTGGNGSGGAPSCETADFFFQPKAPTVYVLVDQSGSIYDVDQWVPLRDAMLPLIQERQEEVRFGFGSFTGTQALCTGLADCGVIGFENYGAIAAHYNSLPTTQAMSQETPTTKALGQVTALLGADGGARGTRSILLVVADDDSDFCDNSNPQCGVDAQIAAMQATHALGIDTYVYAIDNAGITQDAYLDYWAQAGLGQQPNWTDAIKPSGFGGSQVYYACQAVQPWYALWQSAARPEYYALGDYSAAGGTALATLDPTVNGVVAAMGSRIQSLTSCVFELVSDDVSGVQTGPDAGGSVWLDESPIPEAQWRMNSATELELLGAACTTYKSGGITQVSVGFSCNVLIPK